MNADANLLFLIGGIFIGVALTLWALPFLEDDGTTASPPTLEPSNE